MSIARMLAWERVGTEEALKLLWKRVAYGVRYSNGATLTEIMSLEQSALQALLNALGEIVQEENSTAKR